MRNTKIPASTILEFVDAQFTDENLSVESKMILAELKLTVADAIIDNLGKCCKSPTVEEPVADVTEEPVEVTKKPKRGRRVKNTAFVDVIEEPTIPEVVIENIEEYLEATEDDLPPLPELVVIEDDDLPLPPPPAYVEVP